MWGGRSTSFTPAPIQPVFLFGLPRQVRLDQVAEVVVGQRVELVLEPAPQQPLDLFLPRLLLKPAVLEQLLGAAERCSAALSFAPSALRSDYFTRA
jgi:hypothetical protein